ncbi:MAG: hypothetical protein JWP97_3130 [Labilithrix sp.]|nr:hypothetical protein [Labilithrix sp.]
MTYENVESVAALDLWRVQLAGGEIRTMTLDALDEAFQAGTIDESTRVMAPGAHAWSKLAEAAGLDSTPDGAPTSEANSLAPMAVDAPFAPSSAYLPVAERSLPDVDLDALGDDAFKAKKGKVVAAIALAALLVGGLGFAASKLAPVTAAAANALQSEAALKGAAAQPRPASEEDQAAFNRLQQLTEEQRVKLLEADKAREAREAARRKEHAPAPGARRSGPQPKSGSPFQNGGDKYDPLNGAL